MTTAPDRVAFSLTVPRELLLTSNQRLHWRKKAERTKALRILAWAEAFRLAPYHAMAAADCVVHIGWPDRRRRDAHNIMPTIKACIDGVVGAGLLPDDSDKYLTGPDLRPVSALTGAVPSGVLLRFEFTPREPT